MGATIGVRPDLDAAMQGSSFWIKAAYTLSIAMVAMSTAVKLARPDASVPRGLWLLAVPALLLAGVGVVELASTPSGDWLAMWLGQAGGAVRGTSRPCRSRSSPDCCGRSGVSRRHTSGPPVLQRD
jgi:hypothetical protein